MAWSKEGFFGEVLKKLRIPENKWEKIWELHNLDITIPLGSLPYQMLYDYEKNTISLNFNKAGSDVSPKIANYLKVTHPDLKSYLFEDGSIIINFDNLESQNDIETKTNDVSLALSDRRVIVVIADNDSAKIPGTAHYTMSKAKELFKFPPNHPIVNTAYAMAEVYPDVYRPVAEFHDYYKQRKSQAFNKLCASLGAKEIKEFDSPWLHTEPSWQNMYDLRRENHLQEMGVEFSYVDDMGINANLTSNFKLVGVNIGGSFSEMTKIRLSYRVIFW